MNWKSLGTSALKGPSIDIMVIWNVWVSANNFYGIPACFIPDYCFPNISYYLKSWTAAGNENLLRNTSAKWLNGLQPKLE